MAEEELSPEGEAIAAYGAATMAALKILVICLQSNGALEHGQYLRRKWWRAFPTLPRRIASRPTC